MKFSGCGQLLATAGQDHVLRVWVLKIAFNYFLDIRNKCNADVKVSRKILFLLYYHIIYTTTSITLIVTSYGHIIF